MASGTIERNTFIKGLMTEASPINFPENASVDEENFVLNTDGTRQRRLGLQDETDSVIVDLGQSHPAAGLTGVHQVFLWDNAGTDGDVDIAVYKFGNKLHFFDRSFSTLSEGFIASQYLVSEFFMFLTTKIDCASINGDLVVVNDANNTVVVLSYDNTTNTVSHKEVDPEIRDLYGIESAEVDYRPTTLYGNHKYNLRNQGWSNDKISAFGSPYPSNADQVHVGKTTTGAFDKTLITGTEFGTTPAAKGKFIISVFERGVGRNKETSLTQAHSDEEKGSFSCVASGFGRVWFSGIVSDIDDPETTSPNYTGTVFFSRIAENNLDYGKFYQDADPSAEIVNELVPNDGGLVKIAEAGKITKLVNIGGAVVAFSRNGVWSISGSDGIFRADDFSVDKITDKGLVNTESVVVSDNQIFYWSVDGIYAIGAERSSLVSVNLTNKSIKSLYAGIPKGMTQPCQGFLDRSDNTVHWIHRSGENSSLDSELILNLDIEAWSKYVYYTDSLVVGVFESEILHAEKTKYVVAQYVSGVGWICQFKELSNTDFEDDGNDAEAYLITGHELFQDTQRSKQVNYLSMHFHRTETGFTELDNGDLELVGGSSCLVTPNWGFSTQSCKEAKQYQTYKDRKLYMPSTSGDQTFCKDVITSKTRVRGRGVSYAMKIETEPQKDLHLLGWGLSVEGTSSV